MAVVGKATVEIKGNFDSLRRALAGALYQYTAVWDDVGTLTADMAGIALSDKSKPWAEKHGQGAGDKGSKALIARIQGDLAPQIRVMSWTIGSAMGEDMLQSAIEQVNAVGDKIDTTGELGQIRRGEAERKVIFDPRPRKGAGGGGGGEVRTNAGSGGGGKSGGSFGQRFWKQFGKLNEDRKPAPFEDIIKNVMQNFMEMMAKQTVIYGLISGASSLALSLVSFGAGGLQGAAGFLPLINIFAALAQGMLVGKALFGGISKAIKAVQNVNKKVATKGAKAVDKTLQIARARLNLKQATLRNSRAMGDAMRKNIMAERKYIKSLEKERKARERLDDARKRAEERIEDLQFAMEDATLSEERAVLNLKKAEQDIQRARSSGADIDEIYELDLAYREQELELRQIREANQDLVVESRETFAKGIEHDEGVVAGLKGIEDAARASADAKRDMKRAFEDAPLSIEAALLALQGAILSLKRSLEPDKATQNAFTALNDAMKDLSPAAQRFVYFWVGNVTPKLKQIKKDGQEAFFPGFQRGVEALAGNKGFVAVIKDMVVGTSGALGGFAENLAKAFADPDNLDSLKVIFDTNTGIIAIFGRIVVRLMKPMLQIAETVAPFAKKMAERFEVAAGKFADFIDAADESGALTRFFADAEKRLSDIKEMFKAFGPGLKDVLMAALPAADTLIKGITDMGKEWSNSFNEDKKADMKGVFLGSADNFLKIAKMIGSFFGPIFRLSGNQKIGDIANAIDVSDLDALEELFNQIDDDIVRIIDGIGSFAVAMQSSASLQVFFTIMSWVVVVPGTIIGFLAPLPGISHAIAAYTAFLGAKKAVSFFFGIVDLFRGGAKKTKKNVITIAGAYKGFKNRKKSKEKKFMQLTGSMEVWVRENTDDMKKSGNKLGREFVSGAVKKLVDGTARVKASTAEMATSAIEALRIAWQAHSPALDAVEAADDFIDKLVVDFTTGMQSATMKASEVGVGTKQGLRIAPISTTSFDSQVEQGMQNSMMNAVIGADVIARQGVKASDLAGQPLALVAGANTGKAVAIGIKERDGGAKAAGGETMKAGMNEANNEAPSASDRASKREMLITVNEVGKTERKFQKVGHNVGKKIDIGIYNGGRGGKALIAFFAGIFDSLVKKGTQLAAKAWVAGEALRNRIKRALKLGTTKDLKLPKGVKDKVDEFNKAGSGMLSKISEMLERVVVNLEKAGKKELASKLKKKLAEVAAKLAVKAAASAAAGAATFGVGAIIGTIFTVVTSAYDAYQLGQMFWEMWSVRDELFKEWEPTDEDINSVVDENSTTYIEEDETVNLHDMEISFATGGLVTKGMAKSNLLREFNLRISDADRRRYMREMNEPFREDLKKANAQLVALKPADLMLGPKVDPITGDQGANRRKRRRTLKKMASSGTPIPVQKFAKGGLVKGRRRVRDENFMLVAPTKRVLPINIMEEMGARSLDAVRRGGMVTGYLAVPRKRQPEGTDLMGGQSLPEWLTNPSAVIRSDATLNNIKLSGDWRDKEFERLIKYFKEKEDFAYLKIPQYEELFIKYLKEAIAGEEIVKQAEYNTVTAAIALKEAQARMLAFGIPTGASDGLAREIIPPMTARFALENTYESKKFEYDAMGRIRNVTGEEAEKAQAVFNYIKTEMGFEKALFEVYQAAVAAKIQEEEEARLQAERDALANQPPPAANQPATTTTTTTTTTDEGSIEEGLRTVVNVLAKAGSTVWQALLNMFKPGDPIEAPILPYMTANNLIGNYDSKTRSHWRYPLQKKRFTGKNRSGHSPAWGVDISGSGILGEPVVAIQTAKVTTAKDMTTSYGKHFILDHIDGSRSVYAHLSYRYPDIKQGENVLSGKAIGKVGNTGNSRGAHLHFELFKPGNKDINQTVNFMNARGVKDIANKMGQPTQKGRPRGGFGGYDLYPFSLFNFDEMMRDYRRRLSSYLAEGAIVEATVGGVDVIIGEGGRSERVTPLDPEGRSEAEDIVIAAMEELLNSEMDIAVTNKVHVSPKPSLRSLTDMVSRELMFMRRHSS